MGLWLGEHMVLVQGFDPTWSQHIRYKPNPVLLDIIKKLKAQNRTDNCHWYLPVIECTCSVTMSVLRGCGKPCWQTLLTLKQNWGISFENLMTFGETIFTH